MGQVHLLIVLLLALPLAAQPLAFPTAEGFGAAAKGGRGGDVYHVTNLNDTGPGSLRAGIQTATGPRTVVFDLSGTIQLASALAINKPFLTLAGQTAPGDGITVAGWTTRVVNTHDVIVRYLRFRAGDGNCPRMQDDSLQVDRSQDVILDHVSASWSIDETLSVTNSDRITVQWSFIASSLNRSCHEKGEHGYGTLLRYGSGSVSFHHNLYAHHRSRNPRLGDNVGLDFVNNVIYNHGGEAGYSGPADEGTPRLNYVGNYIVAGPSTSASRRLRAFLGGATQTRIFQKGNLIDGNLNAMRDGSDTGWAMFAGEFTRETARFDFAPVKTDDAATAYQRVLESAGASLVRDAVDRQTAAEVAAGTGKLIDSQKEAGGFPDLKSRPAPLDTDQDGIPDAFDQNPRDASDGPRQLEAYLESLLKPPPFTAASSTLVDDTFADGDSQNQDVAANSLRLFDGRTTSTRTDSPGSVMFDLTATGASSEAFWAYFTPSGQPIDLGVGERLSVSVTFSLDGFASNGQDIRWGVLDSLGTRNPANLAGGQNDASFIGDTGYGLQYYGSGNGRPFVLGRRALLTGANIFNNFGDFAVINGTGPDTSTGARQPLVDGTNYTLTYTIERTSETNTRLVSAVTGGTLTGLEYSGVESTATPATTFDYFAFRIAGTNFARRIAFTRLLVEYTPAAPVITSQPQPTSLTLQVGGTVTLTAGASGNSLTYQWRKDDAPLGTPLGSDTPSLKLENVKITGAGQYVCVVTNAGGQVSTNPVTVRVSAAPVPPPPAIVTQPADTTVTRGGTAQLFVGASGANLLYQWLKNGAILPGATQAALVIPNVQVANTASYAVVVSNSSGSITSRAARLLVVSAMVANAVSPHPSANNLCPDTPLTITFNELPVLGRSGRIRFTNSRGQLIDTIDLSANPQTKLIGGNPFSYLPVLIQGNTASLYPHQALPEAEEISITLEPGVFTDTSGAPYAGFADPRLWYIATRAAGPAPGTTELTVSGTGAGHFCTIQGAIDFVPAANLRPVTVTVLPGTYSEIVYVPATKPFLTVRSTDRNRTIVQYPNNNNLNPTSAGRAMFGVDASDFTLEDITLINTTPKGGSQAEAFRGQGRRILLNRVTLKSYQDTLQLSGLGFVNDSYLEGDVDFLWGSGVVFVRNTEIKTLSSGGYLTQIRNARGQNGMVFVNCRLTSDPGVTGVYLSRIDPTVFPDSQVVFIDTAIGPHIIPAGWLLNNATVAPSVQFWESGSRDLSGGPFDVTQRAPFSRQLTAAEAAQWSSPAFVLGGWIPLP